MLLSWSDLWKCYSSEAVSVKCSEAHIRQSCAQSNLPLLGDAHCRQLMLDCCLRIPCVRHLSISRICTATRASPLPLVEMVIVKGLNSQQATLSLTIFAGTCFADSKSSMSLQILHGISWCTKSQSGRQSELQVLMIRPHHAAKRSAAQNSVLPHTGCSSTFGTRVHASKGL